MKDETDSEVEILHNLVDDDSGGEVSATTYKASSDSFPEPDLYTPTQFPNHSDMGLIALWTNTNGYSYRTVGTTWPRNMPADEQKRLQTYYRGIPEEFYSFTNLPVVTPENALEWLTNVTPVMVKATFFHLQENMNGSSRLTLTGYIAGLLVAFPIDSDLHGGVVRGRGTHAGG